MWMQRQKFRQGTSTSDAPQDKIQDYTANSKKRKNYHKPVLFTLSKLKNMYLQRKPCQKVVKKKTFWVFFYFLRVRRPGL